LPIVVLSMALSIEPSSEVQLRVCGDCGRPFSSVHGFLYENGDAYAVYHALLQTDHPSTVVDLALSFGNWVENATAADRTRVRKLARAGSGSRAARPF
jgi:hypothetical protein